MNTGFATSMTGSESVSGSSFTGSGSFGSLDSFPAFGTVIGAVRINAPFKQHYNSYETAAWWEDREAVPGIYPIVLRRGYHYPRFLQGVVKIAAKVTDDYFPGLWGGMPISNEPYKPKHVGEDREIIESFGLAQLIADTGTIPSKTRDFYLAPKYWILALEEAETELHCAYEYLVGTDQSRFEHCEHHNASRPKPISRPGCYQEFLKGDGKYDQHLSAVAHAGSILDQRGKEIAEIRRRMGYLAEKSDMWRRLHNENTRWARDFLFLGEGSDLTEPFVMPSSPLKPEDVPWERYSAKSDYVK